MAQVAEHCSVRNKNYTIIQLLSFVEINIRIYQSKKYDIYRGHLLKNMIFTEANGRGKYHVSWIDKSLY